MKKGGKILVLLLGLVLSGLPATSALADVAIQELPSVVDKFMIGIEANTFYRFDHHPYYGAPVAAGSNNQDANWGELFGRLNFTVSKNTGWAELEAKLSPVYMATIGQDVYGVFKDKSDVDFNKAYIKFGKMFNSPFSVTVGMQDIQLEKQFVIGIGRIQNAALWLLFNQSWPFGVRVDGDFGDFKTTAFWAKSGRYVLHTLEDKTDVYATGVDLHYDVEKVGFLYGGFYAKYDNTLPGTVGFLGQPLAQTNTYAFDIGADATPLEGLNLEAESVFELGDIEFNDPTHGHTTHDRRAFAWVAGGKYTLPVDLSPYIRFQYMFFSGDDNQNSGAINEYDPMFFGWYVWTRWVIGELVGETQTRNTNSRKLIAEVGLSPLEPMLVHFFYIKHLLVDEYYPMGVLNPVPVTSHNYADEFNLFMDYQVMTNLFVHTGGGYIHPNKAAEEVFGSSKDALFCQLWLMFTL